jgi:hypothetical protein
MVEATDGISLVRQLGSRRVDLGTLTHSNNVTFDIVTKGQVSGNRNQDVHRCGGSYAGGNNAGSPESSLSACRRGV